jgi:hypothetical protein
MSNSLTDSYVRTPEEALAEIRRRRSLPEGAGFIHRYEPSPYGGYRVRTISPDFEMDFAFEAGGVDLKLDGHKRQYA